MIPAATITGFDFRRVKHLLADDEQIRRDEDDNAEDTYPVPGEVQGRGGGSG